MAEIGGNEVVIDSGLLAEKFKDLRERIFSKPDKERVINDDLSWDELQKLPDEETVIRKNLLWDEFEKLTVELSSILPCIPDTSIFEIEDLLFLDISQPTVTSEIRYTGELSDLIDHFHSLYYNYPRTNKKIGARLPEKKFIFVAYLQLFLISEDYNLIKDTIENIYYSGLGKKPLNVCLGITLMKIFLLKGIPFIEREITHFDILASSTLFHKFKMFSVMLWKNLPEGINEEQRRILKWLKYQASIIQPEYMKMKMFADQKHILTMTENPLEEQGSIEKCIKQIFTCKSYNDLPFLHHQNDNIYNFFMSANTTEQRRDRMERFIKGCFEATKNWSRRRFERFYKYSESNWDLDENEVNLEVIPFRLRFSILISKLIEKLDIFVGLRCIWSDESDNQEIDDMCRHIDKYSGHKIDPYIPEDATDDSVDLGKKDVEQIPDLNNMENSSNMPDYSFEKHFIYDQFMKRIHVLNIIITAYRHCSEFLKSQGIEESDEGFIFRRKKTEYTRYFKDRISNLYTIPFNIEMILTKCPFLFFPKIHEHLADKLLKYHKGEHVDEGELEELYFVLNAFE